MTRLTSHFNNNPTPEQEKKGSWWWAICIVALFWAIVLEVGGIIDVLP